MIGRINSTYQVGRMNQFAKRKAEGDAWWLAGGISPAHRKTHRIALKKMKPPG